VEVSASPWAQELQYLKPKILAALERALGPGKVNDLRVRLGEWGS
jgi:Dna[CI] antecedent, DciA